METSRLEIPSTYLRIRGPYDTGLKDNHIPDNFFVDLDFIILLLQLDRINIREELLCHSWHCYQWPRNK